MTRAALCIPALLTAFLLPGCQAQQPAKIGDTPRKATLPDLAGHKHTIPDDFQGQVVLIQFWSISCPLCVEEMTVLESVFKNHQSQGLVVLAINVAQAREEVATFVKTLNVSYPILLDPDAETAGTYGVAAFPATVLLDKQGIVRGKMSGQSGQDALEKLVVQTLNETT